MFSLFSFIRKIPLLQTYILYKRINIRLSEYIKYFLFEIFHNIYFRNYLTENKKEIL